jgi:hypothetical protein
VSENVYFELLANIGNRKELEWTRDDDACVVHETG